MQALNGIYWLSSYPKSGNTWFRIFLANLLSSAQESLNINRVDALIHDEISTSRVWLDEACGFETALLSHDEVDAIKPAVYEAYASHSEQVSYHKTHKAYTYLPDGKPLLPTRGCLGALYFIRNPLDVAVSFAHHLMCPMDNVIDIMGNPEFGLFAFPLRQWLLSWSRHVLSWLEVQDIQVLFLRYEDMVEYPLETFTKAVEFLKLEVCEADIIKALEHTQFHTLQRLEKEQGFYEKPPKLEQFFRKGIVGDWKNVLNKTQIERIIHDHASVMQSFNYGV